MDATDDATSLQWFAIPEPLDLYRFVQLIPVQIAILCIQILIPILKAYTSDRLWKIS